MSWFQTTCSILLKTKILLLVWIHTTIFYHKVNTFSTFFYLNDISLVFQRFFFSSVQIIRIFSLILFNIFKCFYFSAIIQIKLIVFFPLTGFFRDNFSTFFLMRSNFICKFNSILFHFIRYFQRINKQI